MTALSRPLSLPQLAAEEYRRRAAKAAAVVASRQMSRAQAEAHLRPWLAIACTLGADLPELAGLLKDRAIQLAPAGRHGGPNLSSGADISTGVPTPPQVDGMTRWLVASDICPRAKWAPLLAAARDNALDRLHLDGSEEAVGTAAALLRITQALAHDINGHQVPHYRADLRHARAAKHAAPERSEAEPVRNAA